MEALKSMGIITTVSNEVVRQMRPAVRELLIIKLNDPIIKQFCKKQAAVCEEQMRGLDFDKEGDLKTAKELRLLKRFWTDLDDFAQDWVEATGENEQDGDEQ